MKLREKIDRLNEIRNNAEEIKDVLDDVVDEFHAAIIINAAESIIDSLVEKKFKHDKEVQGTIKSDRRYFEGV